MNDYNKNNGFDFDTKEKLEIQKRDKSNKELQRRRKETVHREKLLIVKAVFIIIAFIMIISFFSCGGLKSENKGAKSVSKKGCTVFYPKKTKDYGKEYAKEMAKAGKKDTVIDYKESERDGFHIYYYGKGKGYMTDDKYNTVEMKELNDDTKMIISDHLRYAMKKKDRDEAYTSKFMEDTYYSTITSERFSYAFSDKNLICYFPEYKINAYVPLKYVTDTFNMDIKVEKAEYKKPVYVNPERPVVALTFDDGPDAVGDSTHRILDELYKYDGVATFYIVGRNLGDSAVPVLEKGIKLGNQYGSHSRTHPELVKLKEDEITAEVMYVYNFFEENLGYKMNTYRPPYGSYNDKVDAAVPLAAVLWDVDSLDWKLRNGPATVEQINKALFDKSVVLMHDIHVPSADAVCDAGLVKGLIDKGYQLVDINTLANLRGVELTQGVHLCWD